ncbi:hypothetical protein ALC56_15197 [Trachymyrmex septentrionalis]|uniref:Uncharacterized protein n=1 Tax=Trachymyrmex septentrionalis TaxID=34720 RepID=A0A195EQQ0_9HYME|nr:hypothetical protein ALC56_15197 [Trachymyrmex septentrionalis]
MPPPPLCGSSVHPLRRLADAWRRRRRENAAVHGWVASRRPAGSPQPGSSAPVEVGPPTGVSSVRDTVGGATVSSSLAPGKRRSSGLGRGT